MKKLLTVAMALIVLTGMSGCGASSESELKGKTVKVVTAAPYEPYETMNVNGELEGFDIDLGNAICEELGCTLVWENLDFDAGLLAVQSGQAEMMMAGVSPTEKRKNAVDFSEVYYQDEAETANTVVVLKEKGYKTTEDLKGLTVGVQNGTIQQAAAEEVAEELQLTVETRKDYADIVQEILNGNMDFLICEDAVAKKIMATYDTLDSFLLDGGEASEGNAIAFKKGSSYTEEVNKAIQILKDNGKLAELIAKYF